MIKNKFFLAPLDKINCLSFRLLCKENGADIVSTPMINTNAFIKNKEKVFYSNKKEKPLMVQFIGSKPLEFKECVRTINNVDFIDLNAGCPSPDQIKNGSGSALLNNLPLLKKIVKIMVKYSNVPISVKIRSGWKKNESIKIGKIIQDCGASFLTIHPRTRFENYSTPADWNIIKELKKNLNLPIIANGDLLNPEKVKECIDLTNCDSIMIGREAIHNPFIFNDSKKFIKKKELIKHSKKDRINLIKRFIKLYNKYEKEYYNFSKLRTHCVWLSSNFTNSKKIRYEISKTNNENELISLLE